MKQPEKKKPNPEKVNEKERLQIRKILKNIPPYINNTIAINTPFVNPFATNSNWEIGFSHSNALPTTKFGTFWNVDNFTARVVVQHFLDLGFQPLSSSLTQEEEANYILLAYKG